VTASIPHRQCAGCGTRRPQAELVRVTVQDGRLVVDPDRTLGGRGAYFCPDRGCVRRAARRGSLERRLRQRAAGLEDIQAKLEVERHDVAWKDS
jgi:uncharacterized protein